MSAQAQPREWYAAITSPIRGVMCMDRSAWNRSPAEIERVLVREVLPGEQPTAIAAAACGNADVASAIEAAMTDLARELGCAYSDLIPHNAGLFIPGEARACAHPVDAIRRLFAHVYAGGHVLRAPQLMPDTPSQRTSKAEPSPTESDPRQVALFEE
ncbi:hypothetical protein CNE_1c11670 [Cupriavidus necator N-1]|uniref:Uncharacterized protein n=1 Tax=Cupriavidus necator (strain ATCC 43291 / DSM 13513 / CCUG 52238 / LMG 8453 / N-1) TaxID=1042878 RepID=G0ER04_CUPNN|nr:hypothetical protein [Cupriavidus necator]AEI76522.1 hypothetical protein CNE_1c11670 [Cupriavidus necator N-1]MDX6011357.1 hypothetical protein [Cupriavidus necator]